ncbi:hypothetical protein H6G76_12820 [Nostoc sp. FACHB-152]|uniref:hypothetical protein n=1 Tax=unclassified Nostoc TaxID=2593658 RepID=UPI00168359BF|nr:MULTISPECIES: hypothetical protein [unclassified Nostoc]MBD2448033.1 hypothetical protein [Nostoc sp. FACHB-152]MBD2466140.1 hypothetical protein [Nostoc sp. FACHB-145]
MLSSIVSDRRGKSTEILRLHAELEKDDFHVVYFESSEDLVTTDVDIADVMPIRFG